MGLFFNFLLALLFVVGLAYLAAYLLKRVGFAARSPARYLEQIDYLPLGPKRGVALVQVLDQTLCLGVTDQSIELLTLVDAAVLRDRAGTVATAAPPEVRLSHFAAEMRRRLGNRGPSA